MSKRRGRKPLKQLSSSSECQSQGQFDSDNSESTIKQVALPHTQIYLSKTVEKLLATRQSKSSESEYLVKWKRLSYKHCCWLTSAQLAMYNYQLKPHILRKLTVIFQKNREKLRLKQNQYFSSSYIQVDRILCSTELFAALHHRKANEAKGKWEQSMIIVVSKLINFVHSQGSPIGTLLIQNTINQFSKDNPALVTQLAQNTLSHVLNRIYMNRYTNHWSIWSQIGQILQQFIKNQCSENGYIDQTNQNYMSLLISRQSAIVLYIQWHYLMTRRYKLIHQTFSNKRQDLIQMIPKLNNNNNDDVELKLIKSNNVFKLSSICNINVFLEQKRVQDPNSIDELSLLDPGKFSLDWLGTQYKFNYQLKYLSEKDIKQLDLNTEVNRLFLVKWQDISYKEVTWQVEKDLDQNKIQQFLQTNKVLDKDVRLKLMHQIQLHQILLKQKELMMSSKRYNMTYSPNYQKARKQLYRYGIKNNTQRTYANRQDHHVFKNHKILKQFQQQGVDWLVTCWRQDRNCILADQMGLGKTIQIIAFLSHLYNYQGMTGPFLVLAPLSTLPHWRKQIQQWTDFNCLLYYDSGSAQMRSLLIQQYQFYRFNTTKRGDIVQSNLPKFQILLTNYQIFGRDIDTLKKIPFQHIVLDQAHRLKNKQAQMLQKTKQLPCSRLTLLTGTPVQNNIKQLWTLLNIVDNSRFASQQQFILRFGNMKGQEQTKQLKKIIKPYMLRRVKQDVQASIPQLSQIIIDVEMTKIQKTIYKQLYERNRQNLIKGVSQAGMVSLCMRLRKCCNHPFLVSPELQAQLLSGCDTKQQRLAKFQAASGKCVLLLKLLNKFKAQGKKVLIFSQFVTLLQFLLPFLQSYGFGCEILHGSKSGSERHQAIRRFNQNSQVHVFLISTKAGGVGINLITATQIIIYDSDWNPQNDIQATARAHRIGQNKQVTVYRLVTSGTYQSQMLALASKKLGLDKAILLGSCFKTTSKDIPDDPQSILNKQDIQTLLKAGVLGILNKKTDEDEYFAQSIQDILSKNAHRIGNGFKDQSCTFSKTTFSSQAQPQLQQSNFWQTMLGKPKSELQQFLNSHPNPKNYNTPQTQQDIMLLLYKFAYSIVSKKKNAQAYNNEQQRRLRKFLQSVSAARHFNRTLRDGANNLIQQLERPSRRPKVKYSDLIITGERQVELDQFSQIQQESQVKTKIEIKKQRQSTRTKIKDQEQPRTNKKKKTDPIIEQQTKNKIDHIKTQQKTKNKDKKIKGQSKIKCQESEKEEMKAINQNNDAIESEPQQGKQNSDSAKKIINTFIICQICCLPKCTIFCKECKQGYHNQCYNCNITAKYAQQATMTQKQWLEAVQIVKCKHCSVGQQICCICNKLSKIASKKGTNSDNNSYVYPCSFKTRQYCGKYYHQKCLQNSQHSERVANKCGKFSEGDIKCKDLKNGFKCPAHYCSECFGDHKIKTRTIKCIKCPFGIHQYCLIQSSNQTFLRLPNEQWGICKNHLNSLEEFNRLQYAFTEFQNQQFSSIENKKKNSKNQKGSRNLYIDLYKSGNMTVQIYSQFCEQFGLKSMNNYKYNQKEKWCRQCGARYTSYFCQSPWGLDKLCPTHHQMWKLGTLNLPQDQPIKPIILEYHVQSKYLLEQMGFRKFWSTTTFNDWIKRGANLLDN